MSPILLHLPDPVGWIALTPDTLHDAQVAAQKLLGSDINTSIDTTTSPAPIALLTAEAAAVALSVGPQWLLRQARERRILHFRLGKYIRFDPAAIAAYCTRDPRPPATTLGRRTTGGGNRGDS